ncbi:hypothetical protein K2X92_03330 [Candidatus Gracilibacteria bacterium]|nr:hypothetical protein [Candidatus Gracilibacteria bacterium]
MNKLLSLLVVSIISILPFSSTSAATYYNGPKGGCYTYSSSGKKVYVSHQLCARDDEGVNGIYNSKTKKTYYTGPQGGCFYYSGNYKKNYVSHSYCKR